MNGLIDRERLMALAIEHQLRWTFAHSNIWEMEKCLGHGSYGVTLLLRDRDPLRVRGRPRMVLKRPLAMVARDFEDFERETVYLKKMRGSAHHAQIIASSNDVGQFRAVRSHTRRAARRVRSIFTNPVTNVFRILSLYEGPAILMEFIENGSLMKVQDRAYVMTGPLPNRLLWSFYFCLVRACIGLAYPPRGEEGCAPVLETLKPGLRPEPIIHGDIAGRNIMIGNREPEVPEHRSIPILKMIDFGMASTGANVEVAIVRNLHQCTVEMIYLLARHEPRLRATMHNGVPTRASDILPPPGAPWLGPENPTLDPELRDLIIDALRVDVWTRPTLREMLRRTRRGAAKPASAYPGRSLEESDYTIQTLLQRLIHDA